jgi:3-hydroxyisobutyrate dehydrogenase
VTLRVGFIGLGSQGGPMARRVVDEGFPLTIWARRPGTLEPFTDTPATVAADPKELGAASDIVGICVVADADVEDVLVRADGVLAGMATGGVIAVHSTIHPDTCRRLAERAAGQGVAVVDAPVSGGGHMAAQRKLLVLVGGTAGDVARCRPVFEAFGDPVVHLGPLGSGETAKAINNLVFTAQVAVARDTLALADGLGVDRAALATVFANGSGGTRLMGMLAANGFNFSGMGRSSPLLQKDVDIVFDLARAAGIPEPATLAPLARQALVALAEAARAAS